MDVRPHISVYHSNKPVLDEEQIFDYLMPGDAGAFDGHEIQPPPSLDTVVAILKSPDAKISRRDRLNCVCKKCKAHGQWNLVLDMYGPGRHMVAACSNCYGTGYVEERNADHIHRWKRIDNPPAFTPAHFCEDCDDLWDMELSLCRTQWPGL